VSAWIREGVWGGVEGEGAGAQARRLTSQFCAKRAEVREWYESEVQPSVAIIPMEISERTFIARMYLKGRSAPSAIAVQRLRYQLSVSAQFRDLLIEVLK
jgi:hypothetical protein